jgi:hypothetical protein
MAVRIDHVTLAVGVVSTLTFTGPGNKVKVEIIDATASGSVYFTIGTTATPPADPVSGADDIESVANVAGGSRIAAAAGSTTSTVVKLISAGTPGVRVELLGD